MGEVLGVIEEGWEDPDLWYVAADHYHLAVTERWYNEPPECFFYPLYRGTEIYEYGEFWNFKYVRFYQGFGRNS